MGHLSLGYRNCGFCNAWIHARGRTKEMTERTRLRVVRHSHARHAKLMTDLSEYQGVVTCHLARSYWQAVALGSVTPGCAAPHSRTAYCVPRGCGNDPRLGVPSKQSDSRNFASRCFLVCERNNLCCRLKRESGSQGCYRWRYCDPEARVYTCQD